MTGLFREKQKSESLQSPSSQSFANLSIGAAGTSINDIKNASSSFNIGGFSAGNPNSFKTNNENLINTKSTGNNDIPDFIGSSPSEKNNIKNIMKRTVKYVDSSATQVTSFISGETITRNSLKGTIIENADLNAVALMDKEDLDNIKKVDEIDRAIAEASRVYEEEFNKELEKSEKSILKKNDGNAIFGKQHWN